DLKQIDFELILADGETYPHKGKFSFADRQVDVRTGAIKVAALFPNPGNSLRPGLYGRVCGSKRSSKGALLVSQRAVIDLQCTRQIAVIDKDDTVKIRTVKLAETIGTDWIIDEGLSPGERVVVEGVQKVRQGTRVSPKPYVQVLH